MADHRMVFAVTALLLVLVVQGSIGFPSIARATRKEAFQSKDFTARECTGPTPDADGYNFKPLIAEDVWVVHGQPCNDTFDPTDTNCSYYFTFCQKLPPAIGDNCINSSFCKVDDSQSPPTTTNLGDYNTFQYQNRITLHPGGEFVIGFTVASTARRSILAFKCNKTYNWSNPEREANFARAPGLIGIAHSGYDDMVDINFYYDGGCTSDVPKGSSGGLGGGAIFAIVLFVLIAVYLVGGTAFNMFYREKNGVAALPHFDLFLFLFAKIGASCGKGGAGASGSDNDERAPLAAGSGGASEGSGLAGSKKTGYDAL